MFYLPRVIDLTQKGEIVLRADMGEEGYIENVEYTLQITFSSDSLVVIDYYGDDDTWLSQVVENYQEKILELVYQSNGM